MRRSAVVLALCAAWCTGTPAWGAAAAPGEECRRLEKLSRRGEARQCFETLALSNRPFEKAEGLWGLRRYEDANEVFRAAAKADSHNAVLRVRWGRLLLERFNPTESMDLFQEALEINREYAPAYVGMAVALSDEFDRRALDLTRKALQFDPRLLEAQELLAALMLEDGDFPHASEEADKALKLSGEALDAMAVKAAIDLLKDRPTTWTGKMLALSPAYGHGMARIGRWFVLNRRYDEAIQYYRKAVELDPEDCEARSNLGITLMRVGADQQARQQLVQCYEAGYRNKPVINSLTLLDSFKNFVTFKTPHAVLKLDKKEAELLEPYVAREVERALGVYEKKYGFRLPGPVQVELYPNHEDFAVRTLGMPGLGAQGVTFGLSVAMDSPSARTPGFLHWASTLWHELSHVYTLSMTRHRVPRWFTEGLAVHEETAANPEWGDRVTPEVLMAIRKKMLLPVAELDRGFVRPSYPAQVVVSYFQAGRICDYIDSRWGWSKLLAMLKGFSQVETTTAVIERVLDLRPDEFDREFNAWLEAELAAPLKGLDEFLKGVKSLEALRRAKQWPEVIETAARLEPLYPDYVEFGNSYEARAEALEALGRKAEAADCLRRYAAHGGRSPGTLKHWSALEEELGRHEQAISALERVLWIYPIQDEDLHRRLGDLRAAAGRWSGAAEEYAAVVAMTPTDPAAAHYNLARAYHALRRPKDAEEQVVLALEAAPGYRPAQKLLLELNEESKKNP
jgi:tetratricopeptide (TPR) repeat protein